MSDFQRLQSGLLIRQDFRKSVRNVFFDTGYPEFPFSTYGGTIFVVYFDKKCYAITCRHVLKDFEWIQVAIANKRGGRWLAGVDSVISASSPQADAVDSEILDVAILELSNTAGLSFFSDNLYIIDVNTVSRSQFGDALSIYGSLKANSFFSNDAMRPVYVLIHGVDFPESSHDFTLRCARANVTNPEIKDLVGLSGSPVYNMSRSSLSGMVVRAGIKDCIATFWYIDIYDIMQLLCAGHRGEADLKYNKGVIFVSRSVLGCG
ncbi:hypothetical protein [Xanthobacter aminoxidans]|uniref:Trypsin-like peptidase domain-containing protein n=1 Tax=Xanthobacter aminoxidans TaxID=186280 RepID=A0ABW6ZGC3_9HYPH